MMFKFLPSRDLHFRKKISFLSKTTTSCFYNDPEKVATGSCGENKLKSRQYSLPQEFLRVTININKEINNNNNNNKTDLAGVVTLVGGLEAGDPH